MPEAPAAREQAAAERHPSAWPAWVYTIGSEPDYRFSFANERTFLAWIRTALALIAGGVALEALDEGGGHVLPASLLALGGLCAVGAWARWARAERAIRCRAPLPSSWLTALVAVSVLIIAGAALLAGRG